MSALLRPAELQRLLHLALEVHPEEHAAEDETGLLALAQRVVAGGCGGDEVDDPFTLADLWDRLAERSAQNDAGVLRAAIRCLPIGPSTAGQPVRSAPMTTARIGAYELVAPIDRGSFGAVYRARHVDNGMPAAVKLLRLDARSPEHVVRFRREARILARLDHPAIVRVLDSGVHEEGGITTPFVASTLVDGRPFDEALREQPLERRLATFVRVCDGIASAHRAGVVHRDLKPANVLVDAEGAPHVLDFGMARLAAVETDVDTATGQVLGTPGFMSPEQARGTAADERSDVWSLGALLFTAVCGTTPHRLDGSTSVQAVHLAAKTPSRRARSLNAGLDPDLAAILDKAVAFDPQDRYPDAGALADDLRRFLAGAAVEARSPTLAQSLRRLARRHRRAAVLVATTAFLWATGGVVATILWRRAANAEHRLAAASAEALISARFGLRAAADLAETTSAALEQYQRLQDVLAAVQRLRSIDAITTLDSRRLESGLRETAGDLALRLGRIDEATVHRTRVLDAEQHLTATGDGDPADLARAMVKIGDLDTSRDRTHAAAHYQRAHEILERLAEAADAPLTAIDDLAWSCHRLAGIALARGRRTAALPFAVRHLELAERLLLRSPDGSRHFNLAKALDQRRKCEDPDDLGDDVLDLLQRARSHAERAAALEPERRAYVHAAYSATFEVALVLTRRGEPHGALPAVERALELGAMLLRDAPDDVEARAAADGGTYLLATEARAFAVAGAPTEDRDLARRLLGRALGRLGDAPDDATRQFVEQSIPLVGIASSFHADMPR